MITILAIDGGGIRGLIPAMVLAEIEKQTGLPICHLFNYIAGTSTGGILAAMLTVPDETGKPKYTAANTVTLYTDLGKKVFHRSFVRKITTLGGLSGTRYPVRALDNYLAEYLGEARLESTLTNIIIPAYETTNCNPYFFKTTYAKSHKNSPGNPALAQAVRATSAAPTYFRPCNASKNQCYIDGGVFANNPALCAYADAKRRHPKEEDFLIISLGTGLHNVPLPYKEIKNWGAFRWAIPIFGVLQNSADGTVDYQMKALASSCQYFRFQVQLDDKTDDMADASDKNLKRLETLAKQELFKNRVVIESLCKILKNNT